MANPTLLTMPLCVNADKNTIPPTDAGTSGLFSEQYGWQDINSLPLASGGKAPNRRDFNGVFALLGGIAYACQRGQTFEWVNTLPYLKGCVVTDPLDGNKYNAKNDVAEGGTNPSLDPTNWELFGTDPNALTREITPAFNTRDVITTSGTYTAPVTGWYKITAKGGGGGGAGSDGLGSSFSYSGGGGGEGGMTFAFEHLSAGDTVSVVVGAGGAGGAGGANGSDGGDTTATVNLNTYTAGGGKGGFHYTSGTMGQGGGGTGTIAGAAGGVPHIYYNNSSVGESGGGAGGGTGKRAEAGENGTNGGGGSGGGGTYTSSNAGGNGGDGFVWFEYFAAI